MPTPPSVPGVARFRFLGTLANAALWGTRMYIAYAGGPPAASDLLSIAGGLASLFNTNIWALQSDGAEFSAVDAVDLSSSLGAAATALVTHLGGSANGQMDNQIAAVIKYVIDRRYRGGKPKMYLPAVPNNVQLDTAHFTNTYANDMGTGFSNFQAGLSGISSGGTSLANVVNVSFYSGFNAIENLADGRWRNVPKYRGAPVIDVVSSFTCDTLMGSQKRRRLA